MSNPCVSVTIARNPKHATMKSSALKRCLQEITDGVWDAYFDLYSLEQSMIEEIKIKIALMNDGSTPIALECTLHFAVSDSFVFSKKRNAGFTLDQTTGKDQDFITKALRNNIRITLHREIENELKRSENHTTAVRTSLARVHLRREPIKRVT